MSDLEKNFTYRAPSDNQKERYAHLRTMAKDLAVEIERLCPACRERSLALTKIEESVMWANASIARNPE